jgi:hypothetical protein
LLLNISFAEVKAWFPPNDSYHAYYQLTVSSISTALSELHNYIVEEELFDSVLASSQSAALASTYLIQPVQDHPGAPFRFAIFFQPREPWIRRRSSLGYAGAQAWRTQAARKRETVSAIAYGSHPSRKVEEYRQHCEHLFSMNDEEKRVVGRTWLEP